MKCDDIKDRLAEYFTGEADAGARADVEAHLAICPACKQDAEMWARMGAWSEEQPSPALAARFHAMLNAYRAGVEQTEKELPGRRKLGFARWLGAWWPYRPAWQFAIALACLVAGLFGGYEIARRGAQHDEVARLREEVQRTQQLVTVSLLQQQSASERLKGVTYAYRVDEADPQVLRALVHTVKYDDSVDVRLSAVDALRRYGSSQVVRQGVVEALKAPQSPLVSIALIELAVDLRLPQAIEPLRTLKDNRELNPLVRDRAAWALQRL